MIVGEWRVRWHQLNVVELVDRGLLYPTDPIPKAGTLCIIDRANISERRAERESRGLVLCSMRDQYNKAKGRKLALARALWSFRRADRFEFWRAFGVAPKAKAA